MVPPLRRLYQHKTPKNLIGIEKAIRKYHGIQIKPPLTTREEIIHVLGGTRFRNDPGNARRFFYRLQANILSSKFWHGFFNDLCYMLFEAGFSVDQILDFFRVFHKNTFGQRKDCPTEAHLREEFSRVNFKMSPSDLNNFKTNFFNGIQFRDVEFHLKEKAKQTNTIQIVNEHFFRLPCKSEFANYTFIYYHLKNITPEWEHLLFPIRVCAGSYEWCKRFFSEGELNCDEAPHMILAHLSRSEQVLRVYDSNNSYFLRHERLQNNDKIVKKNLNLEKHKQEDQMYFVPMVQLKMRLAIQTGLKNISIQFVHGPAVQTKVLANTNDSDILGYAAIYTLHVSNNIFKGIQSQDIPGVAKDYNRDYYETTELGKENLQAIKLECISFLETCV